MSDEKPPFHNPFAALKPMREAMPDPTPTPTPTDAPERQGAVTAPPSNVKPIPRAVVRMERSGRGGKEVTVVEHLNLRPQDREVWLKALKAALGCGGVLEDESLVLQGDQRKRLPALLTARGVKKVTVA